VEGEYFLPEEWISDWTNGNPIVSHPSPSQEGPKAR
jgi:hypothetical protein